MYAAGDIVGPEPRTVSQQQAKHVLKDTASVAASG